MTVRCVLVLSTDDAEDLDLVTRSGAGVGYARVSTAGQLLDRQFAALRSAGCIRVFADTGSASPASIVATPHPVRVRPRSPARFLAAVTANSGMGVCPAPAPTPVSRRAGCATENGPAEQPRPLGCSFRRPGHQIDRCRVDHGAQREREPTRGSAWRAGSLGDPMFVSEGWDVVPIVNARWRSRRAAGWRAR